MPLRLEDIFREKALSTKRGTISVKVIAGIIGKVWIAPCKNVEIAKELGVSNGVISEAINRYLRNTNVIIYEEDPDNPTKRLNNNINFTELVDYFFNLMKRMDTCTHVNINKESILQTIITNRSSVGKSFLASFIQNGTYKKGLKMVRDLYETIPELIFLLILSLDAEAIKDKHYITFLRCLHKAIILKAEKEYPQLAYVWTGLAWYNLDLG